MDNLSSYNCSDGRYLSGPDNSTAFVLAVKIAVGATCLLSDLGAALIIFTYVAFKDLRTTARQLLVNLSVADIIVASCHFVGLFANYERFLFNESLQNSTSRDPLCVTQAALLLVGDLSQYLWTTAIAVYLLLLIVLKRPSSANGTKTLAAVYLVSWGLPALVAVVYGPLHLYGFTPRADVGWCYVQGSVAEVFAYVVWTYLTVTALPILYVIIQCHVCKFRKQHAQPVDVKLILIPLIFILLRVWSLVIEVPVFYLSEEKRCEFFQTTISTVLVILSGIGLSAQGLANSIFFCVFTKPIRQRLKGLVLCKRSRRSKRYDRLGEGAEKMHGEATTTLIDISGNSSQGVSHSTEDKDLILYGSVN